jgi:hypothetical protein
LCGKEQRGVEERREEEDVRSFLDTPCRIARYVQESEGGEKMMFVVVVRKRTARCWKNRERKKEKNLPRGEEQHGRYLRRRETEEAVRLLLR